MFEFLIGGLMQGAGALMEADDESKALNAEAEAADANAKMFKEAGRYEVMRQQRMAYKTIGAAQADAAASGITADSGSVLDVIRESYINSELDRMNIQYGADMRSLEARSRATSARQAAQRAKQRGYFDAYTSIFGAAARGGMNSPRPRNQPVSSGNTGYGSAGGSYFDSGSVA